MSRELLVGYSFFGLLCGVFLRDVGSREVLIREVLIRDFIREFMRDVVSEVLDFVIGERVIEIEIYGSEEGSERIFDGEEIIWVEEDVFGVYLILRNLIGGGRELKCVRFR